MSKADVGDFTVHGDRRGGEGIVGSNEEQPMASTYGGGHSLHDLVGDQVKVVYDQPTSLFLTIEDKCGDLGGF